MTDAEDGALARAAAAGDVAAFALLMRRHRDSVYRLVRAHIGDADEALDLVQETFLSAYRAIGRYDPARSMRAWLSAIALNKCRDWGRRRTVRRWLSHALPIDAVAERVATEAAGADVVAADRAELARVAAAIARLPGTLKEPLILRTIEGLSQAEAAAVLGVSEKAVETRLYRARAKLAVLLGASGAGG